jgi:hypothetical protein
MSDTSTTFRTADTSTESVTQTSDVPSKPEASTTPLVEKPYTLYEQSNKLPLTADYFDIKLTWDQAAMVEDVQTIESYLKNIVSKGDVADDTTKVRQKMKQIEKLAGIDQLESTAQRIIRLSEFVKYLQRIEGRKNDNI